MFTIRHATRPDAQAAFDIRRLAIRRQCIGAYTEEQIQAWTEGTLSPWFTDLVERHFHLACVGGHPVATAMLGPEREELGAVFVHPDHMGQGIGLGLVRYLEDQARKSGWRKLKLEATLNAAPFYRRCGFVGDAIGCYHSPSGLRLACVPMSKPLLDEG